MHHIDRPPLQAVPTTVEDLDELLSRPNPRVIAAIQDCPGDFAVLGAGGKMGFHVCRMLQRSLHELGRSDRVLAVSRFGSRKSLARFEQSSCDVLVADLSDQKQVQRLPQVENVFYLAGLKFGTSSAPQLLERMNVRMPELVAERCRESRIVALSTGCVYSFTTPASGGSDEYSPTDPPGAYARSCLGREQAFRDASARYNSACALVRLYYSIDLRYGVLVDIAQAVMSGRPVNVETGYVSVIWQNDAVSHILQCLPHTSTPPLIVNVSGAAMLSVRVLAESFARHFGRKASCVSVEAPTTWLSNASRAHRMFGPPAVSEDQMIYWVGEWLSRGGETLNKPTHFENRDGRF